MTKTTINTSRLTEEDNKVKGTTDYSTFRMESYGKVGKKWIFLGWGIPSINQDVYVKKWGNKVFLQTIDGEDKWKVTDTVSELLNI